MATIVFNDLSISLFLSLSLPLKFWMFSGLRSVLVLVLESFESNSAAALIHRQSSLQSKYSHAGRPIVY